MRQRQRVASLSLARLRRLSPESWWRHWRRVLAVKVIGVVIAVGLAMLLVPSRHTRDLFVIVNGLVYLPLTLTLYSVQREDPTPPNLPWFAITLSDIAAVCLAQALFPRLSVAFLGLTAIVMVSAVLLGVRWTMFVAAASFAGLLGATTFGEQGQPGTFASVMAGLLLVGMAYLIGSQADEERRAGDRSQRLAHAIGSVSSSLELGRVLETLCTAAREAMGAGFSVVLMSEDGRLEFGAGSGQPSSFPRMSILVEELLRDPPNRLAVTVEALRTHRPVIVEDTARDRFLPGLADSGRKLGARSGAAVPIVRGSEAVGVLNVYLPRRHTFTEEEVEFLVALAEHAGVAIERARLYEREREAADRLRDLDRLRSEFVATVSHELRTPLTAIEGFAYTLQKRWRDVSDELCDEMLERLRDNSRSLDHLITHLLDFGRLERGEFHIQPQEHDVGQLVRAVLANMVHELSRHQAATRLENGAWATVDRFAFDRIIGNLLSNAVKFAPPGELIEVEARVEANDVLVIVRDHGPGIPADLLDRIFERFYRGPESMRGTGIGLAVARDLAEMHGGRIEAANADGGGAIFTLRLPALASGPSPAPSPADLVESSQNA